MTTSKNSTYVTRPDVLLRLEGLLTLVAACVAYQHIYAGHWGLFALLFLVPDLSLLGYLHSPGQSSAVVYNLAHNYLLPLALGLLAWKQRSPLGGEIALIWLAHISFDRCLGYGLKFPGVFRYTHIQSSATLEHPAVLQ
jgi:Domain of unknown function (DUF4260)